jgi:hypothetical protein
MYVYVYVYTHVCISLYFCVCRVSVLCLSGCLLISVSAFPSKQIKTLVTVWRTVERGLSSPKSSQQPPPGKTGKRTLCTPSHVLTCWVLPPANTQIHQQMKLYNNFNSDSFALWVSSGRVIDIFHNNWTHLYVLVSCRSCWWLLNVTVSGIQAQ